jgi:putative peptidoglycan lipid II flippase
MVKLFSKLLHKEWSGLHQAAFLLAGASLASQLLGLARDRLLAGTFGAGPELDIYYSSFRVPDLIYVTIASFVSVTVLIPFIVNQNREHDTKKLQHFLSGIFTVFAMVMVVVLGVVWWAMPYLAHYLAPGFTSQGQEQWVILSRLLLFSPLVLGLSNMLGGVTQSFHKFFAYVLSPILYNLGIIVGIVFFVPKFGLQGIVWGVIIGAVAHLLVQVPSIYRLGLLPSLTFDIPWEEVKAIVSISLPRTLTLATYQFSIMALVAIGTLMASGAVAVFTLAQNLQSVPMMIVGMSYSVAAFPTLSKLFATGKKQEFVEKIITASRHIVFWSVPAMIFMLVLRAHIVRIILGTGSFDWTDTRLTAAALGLFILSAWAQSLVHLFVRGYYASSNTIKPLVINLFSSGLTVVLAIVFIYLFRLWPMGLYMLESLFRVADISESIILILPLAFTVGSIVNALLFMIVFEKDFGGIFKPLVVSGSQALVASTVGGIVTYFTLSLLPPLHLPSTVLKVLSQSIIASIIGVVVWAVVLLILKNQEFLESVTALRVRFAPKEPMVTEQAEL